MLRALQQEAGQRTDRLPIWVLAAGQFTVGRQKVKSWKVLRSDSPTSSWSSKEIRSIERVFESPGPKTLAGSS